MEHPERLLQLADLRETIRELGAKHRSLSEQGREQRRVIRRDELRLEDAILRFAWIAHYDVERTITLLDIYCKTANNPVSPCLAKSWQTLRQEDRRTIVVTVLSRRSIEDTEAVILDDTWHLPSRLEKAWILDTEYQTVAWVQSLNAAGLTPPSLELHAKSRSLLGAIPLPYRLPLKEAKDPAKASRCWAKRWRSRWGGLVGTLTAAPERESLGVERQKATSR